MKHSDVQRVVSIGSVLITNAFHCENIRPKNSLCVQKFTFEGEIKSVDEKKNHFVQITTEVATTTIKTERDHWLGWRKIVFMYLDVYVVEREVEAIVQKLNNTR